MLIRITGHEYHAGTIRTSSTGVRYYESKPTSVKLTQLIWLECGNANVAESALRKRHGIKPLVKVDRCSHQYPRHRYSVFAQTSNNGAPSAHI
ncbi:hypothetical protein D9M73_285020 [compost metagenome]